MKSTLSKLVVSSLRSEDMYYGYPASTVCTNYDFLSLGGGGVGGGGFSITNILLKFVILTPSNLESSGEHLCQY